MSETTLSKAYKERIAPELTEEFKYTTPMQVPRLVKIVINQGLGDATQDKKLIETAVNEITAITGQKAVPTLSRKDIAAFKLRKKMPVGVMVTLRREKMYEFLERLVRVALPPYPRLQGHQLQARRPRQLHAGYHRADHLPRDQYRQCSQASGYEHHVRDERQD